MMYEKRGDETLEKLPHENIYVLQKKGGYRFSVDAIILADFIRIPRAFRAVELGSGSGVISLILARRHSDIMVQGYDIHQEFVEMSNRSARINSLEKVVVFSRMDVRKVLNVCDPACCDVVFFNPPYRRVGSGRVNPEGMKAAARHELNGGVDDFVKAASWLVREKGRVYAIYTAKRSATLVNAMKNRGIEPKTIRFVHSFRESPASFILVEGTRGGGEETKVPPPLVIYESPGAYSDEMKRIFNGSRLRVEDSYSSPRGS